MTSVPTLVRREANAIFLSPIVYVVTAVFLLLSGYFFYAITVNTREPSLRYVLDNMAITLLFVTPMITMRLLAEEAKSGTLQTLMTAPVTDLEVVLAKFIAGLLFYVVMIAPTIVYCVILYWLADPNPDLGQMVAGYLGLLLLGGMFVSIGLLFSSLTQNQIVAAISSLVVLLLLWVIGWAAGLTSGVLKDVLEYLGIGTHLNSFRKGLIDTRDVIYYVSITAFALFLTVRSLESRKWR